MSPVEVGLVLIVSIVCGWIGDAIGKPKGRNAAGWWLGILFWVVGIIIIALLPPTKEGLVKQETARLEAQREAQRRIDAERGGQ